MQIRTAAMSDVAGIMPVLDAGREIMRQSGNRNQWTGGYPSREIIENDITSGVGRVIERDGRIVGYFAFIKSPEPTYAVIKEGRWIDETAPYHVIHRLAGYPDVHGIFTAVMNYAFAIDRNLRVDTHRDNIIIQRNLLRHGFKYCGIIYLANGDERLAYQKIQNSYPVITLCGSTRFKEQFFEVQKRLTLEGNIVISVGLFGHSGDDEVWTEGTKAMLDDMHKRKIDLADAIYVINVGGYIGQSTRSEIEYAIRTGKEVRYLEPPTA